MGACCEGVRSITAEEIAFLKKERSLGFIRHTGTEVDYILRKYAPVSALQESQLHMIESALGCNFGNLKDTKNNVRRFLELFKSFEGYDFKSLLILGLFLSNSPPKIKARLWFEALDTEVKFRLTSLQIEELLRTLYKITFKGIPLLASNQELDASDVQMYIERWELHFEKFVYQAKEGIMTGRSIINKEEFIDTISGCYSGVSSPASMRKFMKEQIILGSFKE